MLAWRVVKNASDWYAELRPGTISWAPRVLNHLRNDAWKAVNYAEHKPAGGGKGRPAVRFDSGALQDRAASAGIDPDLLDALRSLPDELRRPLCLKVGLDPDTLEPCEELTPAEIGRRLGVRTREVRARIAEAQAKLQALFKPE